MRCTIAKLAALIGLALPMAAVAQINPANQITWPAVTGAGAPGGSCSSLNYGQPYTDTTNNNFYFCTTAGWTQANGTGGPPSGSAGGDLSSTYPNPTVAKVNGVSYGSSPSTNTVAVVTGTNATTYEAVPNAALAHSAATVGGQTCTLGSACNPTTVTVDTSTPVTVSSANIYTMHFNENATAATAITYDLPTAAVPIQKCFTNAYNGSAANTGTLEILTSASGQYIIFTDGTLSATGGYVISGGAAHDSACVVAVDSTHWQLYVQSGTWTKH